MNSPINPPSPPSLQASPERLWSTLQEAGEIGRTADGGVRRLALTQEDAAMRELFISWCEDAGCAVTIDGVGNVFARREGTSAGLAPVLVGSHLDTQISAGRYDGVLGVLAGLELMRTIAESEVELRRPLEIVSWTNEEGARFSPPMMGSGAFVGTLDLDQVLDARDEDGISVREALKSSGRAVDASVGGREIDSYWELHIEQGPELERDGIALGIPVTAYATRNLRISITGETAHAGPTPMSVRRNALVGAAEVIQAVDRVAHAHSPLAKSTSTRIEAWPNAPGIVPGEVTLLADMRHPDQAVLETMMEQLLEQLEATSEATGIAIVTTEAYRFGGLAFDEACVELIEAVADEREVAHRRMWSQAGHDAYRLVPYCPTAMLMCPCEKGISHNPAEAVDVASIAPALDVLLHTVLRRTEASA